MGVAVLSPHDCIKDPLNHQTLISRPPKIKAMKPPPNPNPTPNPKANRTNRNQHNRCKRVPLRPQNDSATAAAATKLQGHSLIMGQVKILKRGEELSKTAIPDPVKENREELDLGSTQRLGSDPDLVPSQIRLADFERVPPIFYAGPSACVASPPPSSLPLPAFFTKSVVGQKKDDATIDLLRILRLDLQ
ncbi:Serine/arginine repetitive matrix-like protein [Quillaja saponaria]|uniref:Serine/arginine repetitive matrix-like protein n=1 Tax=Quillaja saponaria TaxID=32244 RepID=A0AAD7PS57_QUISA|nr:Serine/arginine repetitive matrix-like protein [Quillaja saponaria]